MDPEDERRLRSQTWDAHRDTWQTITNARPIPPADRQRRILEPIPVVARIRWERDGEQLVDTHATAWAGTDVLVDVDDRRWAWLGVWVEAGDVRRR